MKIIPCSLSLLLLIGCSSTSSSTGEKPPRYAGRIQIARYDTTPRSVNPNFEVFADATTVPRPYKIIALLAHHAKPADQVPMMNAIAWNAKQLGADAMIVLNTGDGGFSYNAYGKVASGSSGQPIYRAHAIIYTQP